jgi:hypothetical protein
LKKKEMFKYDLLTYNQETLEIENNGQVTLYNTDELISLSEDIQNSEEPLGLNLIFDSNNVGNSTSGVYFTNKERTNNKRIVTLGEDNFLKSCEYFTVRRIITSTWINQKDEFIKPNHLHESYKQFSNDSLVYAIFHSQNMSLSNDVLKNHFFWMSRDRMKELADNMGYDELYNDARTASDRHVYKLLFGEERIYDKLSPDAKAVLDKATELVELSMEMRQVMANDENHLNSWDAGYAQLKLVWKEYFPEQFKEFRQLYKNMEDRMRPLVYELGFLMK